MLSRLLRSLAVIFVVLGLALSNSLPAMATTWHGCAVGKFCGWDWVSYNDSGGVWSVEYWQIDAQPGDCMNLTDHVFTSGLTTYDRITSITYNNMAASGGNADDIIEFDNWINCNAGGGGFAVRGDSVWNVYNLAVSPWGDYNNNIASIGICKHCAP